MTTTCQAFALEPLDTLLFRDGRPFDQSDEGLTETRSVFPPFPNVVAGALRAQLAREMGWNGRGDWGSLSDHLGSGAFEAGRYRFGPPVMLLAPPAKPGKPFATLNYAPLFPCPAAIYGLFDPEQHRNQGLTNLKVAFPKTIQERKGWSRRILDRLMFWRAPTRIGFDTDLDLKGYQSLLAPPDKFETLDEWLIRSDGLKKLLRGEELSPSQDLLSLEKLVKRQARVGLLRNYATHGAESGMLYAASHVRPHQERVSVYEMDKLGSVAIGVVAKVPPHNGRTVPISEEGMILPLGSMGKAVWCTPLSPDKLDLKEISIRADEIKPHNGYLHYMLVLVSPSFPWKCNSGLPLPEGHEIISAVMRKPVAFSGWNAKEREPEPMRRYFAPGTTWYLRFKGNVEALQEVFENFQRNGISSVGASVGFGTVVIGKWPYARDTKS